MASLILLCGSGGDDYDKRTNVHAPFLHTVIHCEFRGTTIIIVSELQETNTVSKEEKAKLLGQLLRPTELYIFHQQAAKHQSSAASC
jgi:hypothetical protein